MNRAWTIAFAAAGVVTAASGAFAAGAPHEASGRIDRVNPKAMSVTVNHRVYRYGPTVKVSDLKRGERVRLWFTSAHGRRIVSKIEPRAA